MALIQTEIRELRQLLRRFQAGKVDPEHVMTETAIYNEIYKRENLAFKILAQSYVSHYIAKKAEETNLLSSNTAIEVDTQSDEDDKLKCPLQDGGLITRARCLEYSGSHYDDCSGCDQKAITNKLLL